MKRKWNEHSAAWVIQMTEKISGYSFFKLIWKKKNSEWYERSIRDEDEIINQIKITTGEKRDCYTGNACYFYQKGKTKQIFSWFWTFCGLIENRVNNYKVKSSCRWVKLNLVMNIELTGDFFKGASHWRSRTLTTLWVTQRWASSAVMYVPSMSRTFASNVGKRSTSTDSPG